MVLKKKGNSLTTVECFHQSDDSGSEINCEYRNGINIHLEKVLNLQIMATTCIE